MRLAVRAVPLKFELACPMKPLDDAPNRLCVQIRATNRPWRAGSDLLLLQQARLHEALNGMVTNTTLLDPTRRTLRSNNSYLY